MGGYEPKLTTVPRERVSVGHLWIVSADLTIPVSSTKDHGRPQVMPQLGPELNGTRLCDGFTLPGQGGVAGGESEPCLSLHARQGLGAVCTLAPSTRLATCSL